MYCFFFDNEQVCYGIKGDKDCLICDANFCIGNNLDSILDCVDFPKKQRGLMFEKIGKILDGKKSLQKLSYKLTGFETAYIIRTCVGFILLVIVW